MSTIKFNAGKVQYDEDSKKCIPLPHKGQITIGPSADDEGFFDFVWTPKSSSGIAKDELLIMPGDMTFKPVTSCTTGRVCALTFLCSGDKSLYWLQDVGDDDVLDKWTDKDKALMKSVQDLIAPKEDEEDNEEVVPEINTDPLAPYDHYPVLLISDVLTEDVVARHLAALSTEELATRYGALLPENVNPTKEEILSVVKSEFFKKAAEELSVDLSENGVGLIMSHSFGYRYSGEGIDAFLRGICYSKKKDQRDQKKEPEESKD